MGDETLLMVQNLVEVHAVRCREASVVDPKRPARRKGAEKATTFFARGKLFYIPPSLSC